MQEKRTHSNHKKVYGICLLFLTSQCPAWSSFRPCCCSSGGKSRPATLRSPAPSRSRPPRRRSASLGRTPRRRVAWPCGSPRRGRSWAWAGTRAAPLWLGWPRSAWRYSSRADWLAWARRQSSRGRPQRPPDPAAPKWSAAVGRRRTRSRPVRRSRCAQNGCWPSGCHHQQLGSRPPLDSPSRSWQSASRPWLCSALRIRRRPDRGRWLQKGQGCDRLTAPARRRRPWPGASGRWAPASPRPCRSAGWTRPAWGSARWSVR